MRAANLRIEDITAVSPLRDQTRLAFGVFTYKRELKIAIRTDPFYFDEHDSQAWLDQFVENFRNA